MSKRFQRRPGRARRPSGLRVSLLACALALCLPAAGALARRTMPQELARFPERLGYWRTILPFGSEAPGDPTDRAFDEIEELISLVREMRLALDRNPEQTKALIDLRNAFIKLDLDEVMENHPYFFTKPTGERAMRIVGTWKKPEYEIQLGDVELYPAPPPQMGNLAGEISFSRNRFIPESIKMRSHARLDLGPLLFRELLDSWAVFNYQMAQSRIRAEKWAAKVKIPGDALGPNVDEGDREAYGQWMASFPKTARLLREFAVVDDVVTFPPTETFGDATWFNLNLHMDTEAFSRIYPKTYIELKFFFERVTWSGAFRTKDGGEFLQLGYNAATRSFWVKMLLKDGGIAVTDGLGSPTGRVLSPVEVNDLEYTVGINAHVDFYGLDLDIRGFPLDCKYIGPQDWSVDARQAEFAVRYHRPPTVKVSGAYYNLFPTWFIDMIIPGTLEERFTTFFTLMARGNGGDGVMSLIDFEEAHGQHRMAGELSLELPYQIISPVAKWVIEREWAELTERPDPQARRLLDDLRLAILEDFQRIDPRKEPGKYYPGK
ncbi:MAG: hypothetical protein KDH09_02760 [Chrysiogenetes bacterium]|nr:hypothetical protein [Chrysiogenetes bacterium]